ncbi:hypothetical protein DERA104750_15710 [Deinococcus radiodurans]
MGLGDGQAGETRDGQGVAGRRGIVADSGLQRSGRDGVGITARRRRAHRGRNRASAGVQGRAAGIGDGRAAKGSGSRATCSHPGNFQAVANVIGERGRQGDGSRAGVVQGDGEGTGGFAVPQNGLGAVSLGDSRPSKGGDRCLGTVCVVTATGPDIGRNDVLVSTGSRQRHVEAEAASTCRNNRVAWNRPLRRARRGRWGHRRTAAVTALITQAVVARVVADDSATAVDTNGLIVRAGADDHLPAARSSRQTVDNIPVDHDRRLVGVADGNGQPRFGASGGRINLNCALIERFVDLRDQGGNPTGSVGNNFTFSRSWRAKSLDEHL